METAHAVCVCLVFTTPYDQMQPFFVYTQIILSVLLKQDESCKRHITLNIQSDARCKQITQITYLTFIDILNYSSLKFILTTALEKKIHLRII